MPRLPSLNEEYGNLILIVHGGERIKHINKKTKSHVLQTSRCPFCDKCFKLRVFFQQVFVVL